LLIGGSAHAAKPAKPAKTHYFYSVPQTESPDWMYSTPECQPLPAKELERVTTGKQCSRDEHAPGRQRCNSGQKVEVEHAMSGKKEKFELTWFVFPSKARCNADRKAYLSGDE
jgi:hypothetical protein